MRIAVVQHRLRGDARDDAAALAESAARAVALGAELVILPAVFPPCPENEEARGRLDTLLAPIAANCLFSHAGSLQAGTSSVLELPAGAGLPADLGRVALLDGDSCIDASQLLAAASAMPAVAVLTPRSENDLQAEAVLELAIALSDSLAGLVVVADCAGADPGDAGHGGSAIVLLGEVLAEALGDDEILTADIAVPIPQPEPREPLPVIAPLLLQRLALHRGRKLEVTAYPADIT